LFLLDAADKQCATKPGWLVFDISCFHHYPLPPCQIFHFVSLLLIWLLSVTLSHWLPAKAVTGTARAPFLCHN